MNIVNKLTLRHLKVNKGRTVVTSMGIIVSVAMITAVFVAISSFMGLMGDISLINDGNYHAIIDVETNQIEQLNNDDRIEKIGLRKKTDNESYFIESSKSKGNRIGEFYVGDSNELSILTTSEYDGALPCNENEIAVEESFLIKNNLDWKIGDTVSFSYGQRNSVTETVEVSKDGFYDIGRDEVFIPKGTKTAKVTAILHKNYPTFFGYKILIGFDSSDIKLGADERLEGRIVLSNVNYNSLNVIKDIVADYKVEDYVVNRDLLESYYAFDEEGTFYNAILPMGIFVLAIILIASIVLIYNAFAMSTSERVKYLGMLSSVGATKTQKRRSVYFEGLILGAVSIPLGILSGFVGIGITLKIVGDKLISTGMLNGLEDSSLLEMKVSAEPIILVGIVLLSALTIFISSFIPAMKASRITPIEALRQSQEIKLKARRLRTSKLIRKIFGYEGEIASKNLKRNGRKSRVITASIAMSVILFLVCNCFCSMFSSAADLDKAIPYQLGILINSVNEDAYKDISEKLDDMSNVDASYSAYNTMNMIKEDSKVVLNEDKHLNASYRNSFKKTSVFLNAIDDDDFNALCRNNGIDYKQYYGDSFKVLLMNDINHGGIVTSAVFNDSIKGETLTGCFEQDVIIGDMVAYDKDSYICNINPKSSISMYVPLSVVTKNTESFTYTIGVETDSHKQVSDELSEYIDTIETDDSIYVVDYVDQLQSMNTIVFILRVFVYGFIALISLITMFNIINTISTGVAMRRKEFAMLKSIGTTPKGFNKMIMLESALYGIKAVIFAIPISILLSYAMYSTISSNSVAFSINWLLYLATIIVVFLLVGITMIYSVRKLKDDSIIETLKQEII